MANKTYKYAESNYSPIVVHEKKGDRKRGTTIATPIAPNYNRGKTAFSNKETIVLQSLGAMEYIQRIRDYYTGDYKDDWPELDKAVNWLENNSEFSDGAEAVADALQNGEDPLEALNEFREEQKETLEGEVG